MTNEIVCKLQTANRGVKTGDILDNVAERTEEIINLMHRADSR